MKDHELFDLLCGCTSSQLDAVVVRMGLDPSYVPSADSAPATRATEILRLSRQRERGLIELEEVLRRIRETPERTLRSGRSRNAGGERGGGGVNDARRGGLVWSLNSFRSDALVQFLDDLLALENGGLQRDECDLVRGALERIVNAASAVPDGSLWRDSILAELERFTEIYEKWNEREGVHEEAVAHRRAQLKGLRRSRRRLAHRVASRQQSLSTEIDAQLMERMFDAFRRLVRDSPQAFPSLGGAVRRYDKRKRAGSH
jgi:hypothetical protein